MSDFIWEGSYHRGAMHDRRKAKRAEAEERNARTLPANRAATRRQRAGLLPRATRVLITIKVDAERATTAFASIQSQLEAARA